MAVIGIDSHKDNLAGCLIDASGVAVEHRSLLNTPGGHAELVAWAQDACVERVGIEGSGNFGRPAARALIEAGVTVVEVPASESGHERPARARRRRTRRGQRLTGFCASGCARRAGETVGGSR